LLSTVKNVSRSRVIINFIFNLIIIFIDSVISHLFVVFFKLYLCSIAHTIFCVFTALLIIKVDFIIIRLRSRIQILHCINKRWFWYLWNSIITCIHILIYYLWRRNSVWSLLLTIWIYWSHSKIIWLVTLNLLMELLSPFFLIFQNFLACVAIQIRFVG